MSQFVLLPIVGKNVQFDINLNFLDKLRKLSLNIIIYCLMTKTNYLFQYDCVLKIKEKIMWNKLLKLMDREIKLRDNIYCILTLMEQEFP